MKVHRKFDVWRRWVMMTFAAVTRAVVVMGMYVVVPLVMKLVE
jgi:hypothetical protein